MAFYLNCILSWVCVTFFFNLYLSLTEKMSLYSWGKSISILVYWSNWCFKILLGFCLLLTKMPLQKTSATANWDFLGKDILWKKNKQTKTLLSLSLTQIDKHTSHFLSHTSLPTILPLNHKILSHAHTH